jgi:hypothetical protein
VIAVPLMADLLQKREGMWCCAMCTCLCDAADAFCSRCGAACTATAPAAGAGWTCSACGCMCESTDAFCTRCGAACGGSGGGGMSGMSAGGATSVRSVTRDVGPLSFRAMFEPSTLDKEKRTVQVTWTTGARVQRGGLFSEPFIEELSLEPAHVQMGRLQSGRAPLLDSHNAQRVADSLGIVQGAQIDDGGRTGSATVRFDSGAGGSDAMRRVAEGTLSDISVGYRVHKMKKMPDDEATKMPVYRAVLWEPHELSLTPMGADVGSHARSADAVTNTCEFISEERTMPDPVTTPPAVPAATAAPAAVVAPAAPSADQVRAIEQRILGIQRVGLALRRPQPEIDAAIAGGHTLEAFRAAAVDALAAAPAEQGGVIHFDRADPRIAAGQDAVDKWRIGSTAWMIQRAGLGSLFAEVKTAIASPRYANETWARELAATELDPGEFRGRRLVDIARDTLDRAGVNTRGLMAQDVVGQAFTLRAPTQTVSDFPLILENVLYKVLLAQYMVTPDTWTMFCRTGSVVDFRPNKRYRMGTFGSLSSLNELGEFTNKAIPDAERQSLTAGTKGNVIAISRQAIINDDMGAFSTLATMIGRAAKLSIEVDVYALLALNSGLGPLMSDGNTLFHATHNNITTGAAIGSNAIDLDRVAMASQKDPSLNEVLALRPTELVLPVALGGTARQINAGQYDYDALTPAGAARSTYAIANRVGGLFRDIIDTPRVSGTRRYLFADPGVAPTIEVAFLEGQAQPFMDIQQGWRVDGVEWKVREDYGVAAIDFRGAVTNAGV